MSWFFVFGNYFIREREDILRRSTRRGIITTRKQHLQNDITNRHCAPRYRGEFRGMSTRMRYFTIKIQNEKHFIVNLRYLKVLLIAWTNGLLRYIERIFFQVTHHQIVEEIAISMHISVTLNTQIVSCCQIHFRETKMLFQKMYAFSTPFILNILIWNS
jgi:hypothetical protein